MKYNEEELVEIPEIFYSFVDEKPFSKCVDCEKDLLTGNTEYLIERVCKNYKGFKATDIIFDYAICMDCAIRLYQEMSRESRMKLMEYFQSNINLEARKMKSDSMDNYISECIVSGVSADNCDEYQVCGHCIGDKVYTGNPPYMIAGHVLENIMELLSVHTQDVLNGFYQRIRSPSPGVFEPDPGLVLF